MRTHGSKFMKRIVSHHSLAVGLAMVAVVVLVGIFHSIIAPYDPTGVNLSKTFQSPGQPHIFGTDQLGRDVFSRIVFGASISLTVVLEVVAITLLLGAPLGIIAGYRGGVTDIVLSRIADILLAFPSFLLAMAIVTALGSSLHNAMLSVAIAFSPVYFRLARGQVLTLKNEEYITAARAIGASPFRILFRHILINAFPVITVQLTMDAGRAILATAGLSFVGLGASIPSPEWGLMIASTRNYISSYWWIPFFPGLAIFITTFGFMALGDGLRDILDPRCRKQNQQ